MPLHGFLAYAVIGFLACGGTPPKPIVIASTPTEAGDVSESSTGAQDGPMAFSSPTKQACMLHQEAGAHYLCLSGADGQCFHYGSVCVPKDPCVLDLGSGQFKDCKKFSEGACREFGEICTAKTNCLYDSEQRRYRTCDDVNAGGCGRFSATCDPV